MEKFNVQDFKELMSKASDLTDATQKVKPLFGPERQNKDQEDWRNQV